MKKILKLFVFIFAASLLFGCNNTSNIKSNKSNTPNKDVTTNESSSKETKTYRISLFFPTEDYFVNGNEDHKFEAVLESFDNLTNAMDSINNLKYPPVNEVKVNGNTIKIEAAISESIKINSVNLVDETFIVDLCKNGLDGGSFDEDILISSIVKSLLSIEVSEGKVFNRVGENVKFTVEGENVASLMGHFDTSKPIDGSSLK